MKNYCLAIIPARSGSKGIKDKNIKRLNGKPLIYYSIKEAKKSKFIDKLIVSTDSKKIKTIALQLGAEAPFLRPKNLATDKTGMYPVIRHAVDYLEKKGEKFNIILILQPTSPLRTAIDIDKAVVKLINSKADSVVSLCLAEHSPYWMRIIKKDKVHPFIKSRQYLRRQDLPKVYRMNGAIYVFKRSVLINQKSILGKDTRPLIMTPENSIDIDTVTDLEFAGIALRKRLKN